MGCVSWLKILCQKSDFVCGLVVFVWETQMFNVLGLFLLLGFGFRVLQCGFHLKGLFQFLLDFRGKSSDLRNGFCSESGFDGKCNSKMGFCKCGSVKCLKNSDPPVVEELEETKEIVHSNGGVKENICLDKEFEEKYNSNIFSGKCGLVKWLKNAGPLGIEELEETKEIVHSNGDVKASIDLGEELDGGEEGFCDEDEVFDVMTLRKMVKMERCRADFANSELEKERMAAASAAEEAMAMILRLQEEKSLIQMEANQYRRLAEEKQLHDQEVIQSLRWILSEHETESSRLEDQLRMCCQKHQLYMEDDEVDQSYGAVDDFGDYNIEDGLGDGLISSLDMGHSSL